MKRLVRTLCILVGFMLVASMGVLAQGQRYSGVTIRCMMEPHPTTTALIALVPEFEKATGIKVILEEVPYEHLPNKALLNFTTKSSDYDIVHDDWLFHAYGYAKAGYLEPLDKFLKDPVLGKGADLEDFPPVLINSMKVDGKLYGLPLYSDSTFLMYRKDLFEEYGVKVPTAMADLEEAAKKLTLDTNDDGKVDIYGITLRAKRGIHMTWTWSNFFIAFGAKYFDDSMKPVVNSPEAIKATEYYVNLVKQYCPPGATNYGWEENRIAFEQGRAAMTVDASVNAGFAEDPEKSKVAGKVGYALIPKGKAYGINLSLHSLYISSFSKHKEAAFEFIKWATSKETQMKALMIAPIPTCTSITALKSKEYDAKYHVFKDAHFRSVENGNLEYVPRIQETMEVTDTISTYISEAIAGRKTVKQALDEANEAVYQIMKKAGYYGK
ncbi:MAG: ABC transporter substrate-binding protein [Bacteroidota bacterium]